MKTHKILESRVIFSGTLVTKSNFRIGAAEETGISFSEMPILRTEIHDKEGNRFVIPYIPSSSLKGVLRSEFARLIGTPENNGEQEKHSFETNIIFGGKVITDKNNGEDNGKRKDFAALLKIMDSFPLEYLVRTENKTSVLIKRESRTAKKGGLFNMEVVSPGTKFHFKAILDNISPESKAFKLLRFVINELACGHLTLGGGTSRGYGLFEIPDLKIIYYGTPRQLLGLSPPTLIS